MTRMNPAALAADALATAHRADLVRCDPAVQKAAVTAYEDVVQAVRSTVEFTLEVRHSWQRNGHVHR